MSFLLRQTYTHKPDIAAIVYNHLHCLVLLTRLSSSVCTCIRLLVLAMLVVVVIVVVLGLIVQLFEGPGTSQIASRWGYRCPNWG